MLCLHRARSLIRVKLMQESEPRSQRPAVIPDRRWETIAGCIACRVGDCRDRDARHESSDRPERHHGERTRTGHLGAGSPDCPTRVKLLADSLPRPSPGAGNRGIFQLDPFVDLSEVAGRPSKFGNSYRRHRAHPCATVRMKFATRGASRAISRNAPAGAFLKPTK